MLRSFGRRMRLSAVIASALLLAACAGSPGGSVVGGDDASPTAAPSVSPTAEPVLKAPLVPVTAPEILAYCPQGAATHLDADPDTVTSITVCSVDEVQSIDQTGSGMVQRASQVETGGDALLEAYAAPNAPATDGACIALAADPLIVWLTMDDGIHPVYAPVDECGFPTDAAAAAFSAVTLSTIAQSVESTVTPSDPND